MSAIQHSEEDEFVGIIPNAKDELMQNAKEIQAANVSKRELCKELILLYFLLLREKIDYVESGSIIFYLLLGKIRIIESRIASNTNN